MSKILLIDLGKEMFIKWCPNKENNIYILCRGAAVVLHPLLPGVWVDLLFALPPWCGLTQPTTPYPTCKPGDMLYVLCWSVVLCLVIITSSTIMSIQEYSMQGQSNSIRQVHFSIHKDNEKRASQYFSTLVWKMLENFTFPDTSNTCFGL